MTNQVITISPAPQGNDSAGIVNYASGLLTGDGGTPVAYTLPVGFQPRSVVLLCLSSATAADIGKKSEWYDGMPDGTALITSVASGATVGGAASKSLSTTLGPTVLGSNPAGNPLRSVTWPAGAFDATATYAYQIQG